MEKHTKLFYRAVARIRAIGERNGVVWIRRLKSVLKISWARALRLREELIEAGIIRNWSRIELKEGPSSGNVLWKNMGKFRVPKTITKTERQRATSDKRRGLL